MYYLYSQYQNHDYFQAPSFGRLKTWKSIECNGLVYVWYHSENVEPYWDPIKLPQIHNRDNENGKWIYRGRNEFEVIRFFITIFIDIWILQRVRSYQCLFIFHFRLPATLKTFQKTEQMLHICLRFMKYQFSEAVSHQSTQVGLPCGLGMNILYRGNRNQKWIKLKVNID